MKEDWKVVNKFNDYNISNYGRVFSKKRKIFLAERINSHGYKYVALYNKSGRVDIGIHRIVALHFCEGYFDGAVVDHIDGNIINNRCDNLQWVTVRENSIRGKGCNKKKSRLSQFTGVGFNNRYQKWVSRIRHNGKYVHLIYSEDEIFCHKIYVEARLSIEKKQFDDFMSELSEFKRLVFGI